MRLGGAWSDACILNISSRGMLLQSARPPGRGSYVEIRRGPHVIVARVVWAKQHRFGVKSQDCLAVDLLVGEAGGSEGAAAGPVLVERRAAPRRRSRADSSRAFGRAFEFACIGCLAAMGATVLLGAVHEALARPFAAVSAELDR